MISSLEITRLNNEISRLLEKKDSNREQINSLIMDCAAKYEICVNNQDDRYARALPAGEARLAATLDESDVLKERYRRAPAKKNRPMIRAV